MRGRALFAAIALLLARPALCQHAPAAMDPEARRLLGEMVQAYRRLRTLDQNTTYTGGSGGFSSPTRARLVVERPNRILLEVWQQTPGFPEPVVSRFQCDGKDLYIYRQAEGYYTRDRAPRDLRNFAASGASIEMAAICGVDPFAALEQQAHAARLDAPATVDDGMADVVVLDSSTPARKAEARLYISRQDHLLRRFAYDAESIAPPDAAPKPADAPKPARPAAADPDDPDAKDDRAVTEPPVHFRYDNHVVVNRPAPRALFVWSPPAGAMLYQPVNDMLNPKGKKGQSGYTVLDGSGGTAKPSKPLSYRDLLKMGRKQRR